MARRSLLKMYNKVLDNMEGVQSTSSAHGLGPLHHATPKIPSVENPEEIQECISDMAVANKRHDSETNLCHRSKNRKPASHKTLGADSQPYTQPKFHLCRKEEMPSATPHWSSTGGLELKESVPVHLEDINKSERYIKQSSGRRGKSPRVKTNPKTELGPYTPPQFFFIPQKYKEAAKRDDVLVSVDNKVPPSLQGWAKHKSKQEHSNREMENFKDVEFENDTYYNPAREHKRKESRTRYENKRANISSKKFDDYKQSEQPPKPIKQSTPVSSTEIVKKCKLKSKVPKKAITPSKIRINNTNKNVTMYSGNRVNEETSNWGNNSRPQKKLYDKTRWRETHANYASPTYGNETWKTLVEKNKTETDNIATVEDAPKFVYGNDNWKKTLTHHPQEKPKNANQIKEPNNRAPVAQKKTYGNDSWRTISTTNMKTAEEPEPISTKISQQIKDDNSWEMMSEKMSKEKENKDVVNSYYRDKNHFNHQIKNTHQDEEKQTEINLWNDIEPFLPSFLSTSSTPLDIRKNKPSQTPITVEAPEKQDVKENVPKSEPNTLLDEKPQPVPKSKPFTFRQEVERPSRTLFTPLKAKEQESLFKHFQTRSKNLRKQHTLLEKKKANHGKPFKGNRQLSAVKVVNYYNAKAYVDESEVKPKEKDTTYAPGTVCDIDDDGFKLSESTEAFAMLQGENYGNFENMFGGYQTLFIR